MAIDHMVYLSLGGNIGDRLAVLQQALILIKALPWVKELEVSSFYETAPISDIPQSDYLNAVCRFKTHLPAEPLLAILQAIEKQIGKIPKPKNAPRMVDIDMLFFGNERYHAQELEIPHPRWRERLFVVAPLFDLTPTIVVPAEGNGEEIIDVLKLKQSLIDENSQRVKRLHRLK